MGESSLDNNCNAFSWQKLPEFSSTVLPYIHSLYTIYYTIYLTRCALEHKVQCMARNNIHCKNANCNTSNDYRHWANKFSRPLPFPIFTKHFLKWLTTLSLRLKLWSHKMQPNRLISECTAWCCFNIEGVQKLFGHSAQTYGFTCSCPSKCPL